MVAVAKLDLETRQYYTNLDQFQNYWKSGKHQNVDNLAKDMHSKPKILMKMTSWIFRIPGSYFAVKWWKWESCDETGTSHPFLICIRVLESEKNRKQQKVSWTEILWPSYIQTLIFKSFEKVLIVSSSSVEQSHEGLSHSIHIHVHCVVHWLRNCIFIPSTPS